MSSQFQMMDISRNDIGETPLRSDDKQCLYWVDINGRAFYQFDWCTVCSRHTPPPSAMLGGSKKILQPSANAIAETEFPTGLPEGTNRNVQGDCANSQSLLIKPLEYSPMRLQVDKPMRNVSKAALWLLATVLAVPAATAATHRVAPGWYQTIQQAVDVAQAGDTINIEPGVYRETVMVNKSGTAQNKLTLQKRPGATGEVVIKASEKTINSQWVRVGGPTSTVFKITLINNQFKWPLESKPGNIFNPFQTIWPAVKEGLHKSACCRPNLRQ